MKGKQLEVETPGMNKRMNVFITLDFASGKLVYSIHRKRRSREFKYHLKKVMRYAKRRRFKRIVLITDNSPIHRSAESKRFMERNSHFLSVFKLPSYSPNLNEVEHVNRQLKRDVCANWYYGNLRELEKTMRSYLKNYNTTKIR